MIQLAPLFLLLAVFGVGKGDGTLILIKENCYREEFDYI